MLVAVLILSALLLLFLRVMASMNKEVSKPPPLSVQKQSSRIPEKEVTRMPAEEKPITPPESSVKAVRIFFDFNRASINKNVYCIFDRIDEVVSRLGQENFRIVIEGNADSIGPSWYNFNLSKMRAARVADSLSKRLGIAMSNIELVANGSTKPAASNGTREGRAENRRTEVHIYH